MCFNVARMFVQVTKCKHGSATYFTYLVRESFRTPKGPRSRTICNITALPPETRELISQSLQGRSFVAAESLQLTEAWNCGGLVVLHQAWEEFGLRAIFDFVANARMAGLLNAMILGRIRFPSARMALAGHARRSAVEPVAVLGECRLPQSGVRAMGVSRIPPRTSGRPAGPGCRLQLRHRAFDVRREARKVS